MVLDSHVADAATFGEVDFVETWLQSLHRPEDINEVDAARRRRRERAILLAASRALL